MNHELTNRAPPRLLEAGAGPFVHTPAGLRRGPVSTAILNARSGFGYMPKALEKMGLLTVQNTVFTPYHIDL